MSQSVITVITFDLGDAEEKARKVCEESMEFYAAHNMESYLDGGTPKGVCNMNLMMEIGDVFTALVNYCVSIGIHPQECVHYAQLKNLVRGRYGDDISGIAYEWLVNGYYDHSSMKSTLDFLASSEYDFICDASEDSSSA